MPEPISSSAQAAHEATVRLIYAVAAESGFTALSKAALAELVEQVHCFVGSLLALAKDYVDDSRRSRMTPLDFTQACEAGGISVFALLQQALSGPSLQQHQILQITHEPSLDSLDGDEAEEAALLHDQAHSDLPIQLDWLPELPPAHTWQQGVLDPVFYSKTSDRSNNSIGDQRIQTTRLVEKSLRNLIRSTTAATAQSLPELPPPVPTEEEISPANTFKLSISSRSIKVTEEKRLPPGERLQQLQSAANGVADELLDAGLINWDTERSRKRAADLDLAESNSNLVNLAVNSQKRLRWAVR